jgi:hypothetical protein
MRSQNNITSEQIARNQRVTLLELLDRLLDKGVMVKGEILLSVADIDLVYLNLGLLLSSVKTIENAAGRNTQRDTEVISQQPSSQGEFLNVPRLLEEESKERVSTPLSQEDGRRRSTRKKTRDTTLPSAVSSEPKKVSKARKNIDHKNVEKGLVKLVLTLVDLIRKLMEKQAIRRIEDGQLSDKEIEDLGNTFLLLDEKMGELKKKFGLKDEDLNLDLGPLGELV